MAERKSRVEAASGGKGPKRPIVDFSSEELLREAIRTLLSRLPEVKLAKITHGHLERGKDIFFFLPGGLGPPIPCACVVKNAPLSGKVGSPNAALTVLHQIEQALLNPVVVESGDSVSIQKVFVVTPYDISGDTISSIEGHLRDRAGRVQFIGGTLLFDLIRSHWPDFFADQFSTLREYLRDTTERLEENKPLTRISFQYHLSAPDKTISRYYVHPVFHQKFTAFELTDTVVRGLQVDLPSVTVPNPRWREGEPKWIPVRPERKVLSGAILRNCRQRVDRIKLALSCLTDWGYCSEVTREDLALSLDLHAKCLESVWKSYIKLNEIVPNSIVRQVSEQSARAELNREDTIKVLDETTLLNRRIEECFLSLRADLTQVESLVRDTAADGLMVLKDSRYHLAGKIADMARIAPEEMFSVRARESDATLASEGLSRRISFPENLLDAFGSSLLIVGAAGYGKTSFCKWHALNDAQRFNSGSSQCIPTYVALHELAQDSPQTFEDTFLRYVGKSALTSEQLPISPSDPRPIRLYLDGLDEISDPERRKQLINLAKRGTKRWPNVQIVVTARDYIIAPWLTWLPRFNLSDFTNDQVSRLAENWFDKDSGLLNVFTKQLARTPSLDRVIHVPLLATLVILVFRQTHNLPSNRTKLYQIFVELLNEGWDLAKTVKRASKFSAGSKAAVLRSLAYTAHLKRVRQLPESIVRITASKSIKSIARGADWRHVVDELLQDGLLISSGPLYGFAHLSFQEFLAAWHLRGDPVGRRATVILGEFLRGDNWWKEVVCHYIGLSGNPKELRQWVVGAANKLDSKSTRLAQAAVLHREIGYAFPDLEI